MYSIIRSLKKYCTPLPFFLLGLYIFFMYNSQETLLSTAIHSVVMFAMIAVTIVYCFFKMKLNFTIFSRWYLLFSFLCLISSSFYLKSDISIIYPILVSFIISYCYLLNINTPAKIDVIANIYVISSLIMIAQIWFTGQLEYILIDSAIGTSRLGGEITGNANIFSALLMYSGVFAAWGSVYAKTFSQKIAFAISLLLILIVMAISGGRKTIVAVMSTLVLFFLLKGNIRNFKRIIYNLIISLLIITAAIYAILNIPFLYDYVGNRFEGLFSMLSGRGAEVSGDGMRSKIFIMAYEGWLDSPLFGHGIDSFKEYNRNVTGHNYYAHNNYVELLYDVGLIGFVVYYWIFVYIYKQLKTLSQQFYKYKILGYGLLIEMLIFDFGGVSYYLVGNIVTLAIAYKCSSLIKNSL